MAHEDTLDLEFRVNQLPLDAYQGYRVLVFCQAPPEAPQYPQEIEIGRTEKRTDLSTVVFNDKIRVLFRVGITQEFKIYLVIYKRDSEEIERVAGETRVTLLNIIKQAGTLTALLKFDGFDLNSVSILTITAQAVGELTNGTFMQFAGHCLNPRNGHPVAAYFTLSNLFKDGTITPVLLHRSEVIVGKESPKWRDFVIPTKFFSTSADSILEICCYNYNNNTDDTLIGKFTTTFYQLLRGSGSINKYILHCAAGRKKEEMSIELIRIGSNQSVSPFPTLLASGTKLHFTIAVDFTTINGNQNESSSLHVQHPHVRSLYATRLREIAESLEPFESKFSVLGFGAKIPPKMELSQCFALNGNIINPYLRNADEIEKYYRMCAMSVLLFAPTNYSNVISSVTKQAIAAKKSNRSIYFVLFILTNGNVSQNSAVQDSVDELCKASSYPISVIFVGLGNQDHPLRDQSDSKFRQLISPTIKAADGKPLGREAATIIDGSEGRDFGEISPKIFSSFTRHMVLWNQSNS